VEKPVCLSFKELQTLIETSKNRQANCTVGMQKRYSSCTALLKKHLSLKQVISYNYHFGVGLYPEGNILWDIFIHPLDLVTFLFGEAEIISIVKTKTGKGSCLILLQVRHKNIVGTIELSTDYSWLNAFESLIINANAGVFQMKNHQSLSFTKKPKTVLSIPLEKLYSTNSETVNLFSADSFLPIPKYNPLVYQGYYEEINSFINSCENNTNENISSLESLTDTYTLLEKIDR
jgi:virulence factor